MIIDVERALHRLADKDLICRSSVESIIFTYGKEAKVGRRVLERAIFSRGAMHFRNFFAEALGWPESLTNHLKNMEDKIIWGRKYRRLPFADRNALNRRAHVAAVLAYVAEMKRP